MALRNPLLAGRAADLRDVGRRVLHLLVGGDGGPRQLPPDCILVTEDLAPSDAASLDRTEAVIRRMSEIGLQQPGVQDAVAFPGLSISGFSVAPNAGVVFFGLKIRLSASMRPSGTRTVPR